MLTKLFFPEVPGVRVDRVWREGATVHVAATTTRRAAQCPLCQRRSKRVHSRYDRTIADLPCCGDRVILHLHTRRFVCRVRWCRRRVFTERIPALVCPSARRTARLGQHLLREGFERGGRAGARHAAGAGMPVSVRTLLRLMRAAPVPETGSVRVLGVDDWARRKGRTYGTLLVNLETHRVLDLLPDRTAETLAAWLRTHPEIEVITRDRAGAYADGARQGAPQARQVADRFHLLKNVTDALERYLMRKHAALRRANQRPVTAEGAATEAVAPPPAAADGLPPPLTRIQHEQQERRARRHARYQEVMALRAQGHGMRSIARLLGLAKGTVQRFVRAEGFPERQPRAPRPTLLTPFEPYLQERWAAGCHNAKRLWLEIRARGFTGGHTIVSDHLRAWRDKPARPTRTRPAPTPHPTTGTSSYSARQTCWLLLRAPDGLTPDEQAYLTRVYHACPQVAIVEARVEEFATLLRERDVPGLYTWLRGMEGSGIPELRAIARGMWQDRQAVEAAVAVEWSNGQVEGQVNKLKVIKRSLYGRANFDLLRQCVLHAA